MVVVSAAFLIVRELATRRIVLSTSPLPIALLTALALAALTGTISLLTGWGPITPRAVLLLVLACGSLTVGYVFAIQTVRVGDLSISAPFRYSTLIGAVAIGAVAFDEPPDLLTLAGCALIVIAGIDATRSDRRRQQSTGRWQERGPGDAQPAGLRHEMS